jgi:hypothetical protein
MNFSPFFLHFLNEPSTWITVNVPLFFVVLALIRECFIRKTHFIYYFFFLISIPLSMAVSVWTPETLFGLHIFPIFMIMASLYHTTHRPISLSGFTYFALSYLNLLSVDILSGQHPEWVLNGFHFLYHQTMRSDVVDLIMDKVPTLRYSGIGGDGFSDLLFSFSVIAFIPAILWKMIQIRDEYYSKLIIK